MAFLEDNKLEMHMAGNGQEALDILKNVVPDVILMDIDMPVMNGYDATKKIRQINELKGIPVIALTALVMKEQVDKYSHVFDDFLAKPLDYDLFIETVRKYLPHIA